MRKLTKSLINTAIKHSLMLKTEHSYDGNRYLYVKKANTADRWYLLASMSVSSQRAICLVTRFANNFNK